MVKSFSPYELYNCCAKKITLKAAHDFISISDAYLTTDCPDGTGYLFLFPSLDMTWFRETFNHIWKYYSSGTSPSQVQYMTTQEWNSKELNQGYLL